MSFRRPPSASPFVTLCPDSLCAAPARIVTIAGTAGTFASEPREPSNKQTENLDSVTEVAGGKSAEPLRARKCAAISGITADVPRTGSACPKAQRT